MRDAAEPACPPRGPQGPLLSRVAPASGTAGLRKLQPSVHLVPPVTFILHPVPSPAEERESLGMRIQQVLNQCQTNEGGRQASSQAHTLHLCADRKGVGSQERVMGEFRVYQGHRETERRAPGGGWAQGAAGDPE